MTRKSLLSTLTIATVGLGSKAFLRYLCADTKVVGFSRLLDELDRAHRRKGKGVLTVSNHISVLDDPLAWGILPVSHFTLARPMRWAFGASDICFTNPFFSEFFRQGRVVETFRGKGVKQEAVDKAIQLLNEGEWIHIFPEGKVAQPPHANLRRLKWGIGRMLMETNQLPAIIPMWLTGFDQVMDANRGFPSFLPRTGKRVGITFGESDAIQRRIDALRGDYSRSELSSGECKDAEARAMITSVVQEELRSLGERVSGEVTGVREGKEMRD